ncbi:MAG: nicotinate-nucleotide adenylyltransferase [Calditrichia bacterium]
MKNPSIQRIGIYGGTFDPVHLGHLIVANIVREELRLDQIWFIPAYYHILKDLESISPSYHRLNMLKLAVQDNPDFEVMDTELKKETITRTIDTITELKEENPGTEFYFLLGADALNSFDRWYQYSKILEKVKLVTFGRPPFELNDVGKRFISYTDVVHTPMLEISSTEIRTRVKEGKSIKYFVTPSVEEYIYKHHLYK